MRPSRARAKGPLLALVLLAATVCPLACRSPFEGRGPRWPTPSHGVVVSEHPLATQVGVEILERGGNAADAAVATALALAVVYPIAGNLGGGGFALWVDHEGLAKALDFRETAPAAADAAAYRDGSGAVVPARSRRGPLAVGVPGSPAGLYELWSECGSGRLSWAELVRPAIHLASWGFEVGGHLARDLRDDENRALLTAHPTTASVFYPNGDRLRSGQMLRQPHLARTLERLAADGPDGFYRGPTAQALVVEVARTPLPDGGLLRAPWITAEDLVRYRPVWREPLRGWFRGLEVVTMPPPSSGGIVVLQALGVLEGLPLPSARPAGRLDAEGRSLPARPAELDERTVHWWIEALRRSFADRALHMGDPDFHDVPVTALLSPAWIAERRVSIGERAAPDVAAMAPPAPVESAQTTHLSVLDAAGNAVSLTTTLNGAFGNGVMVTGAGFLLNNELDDFALAAGVPNQFGLVGGEANAVAPGKRPLSSMTPTVVREGGQANVLVLGSPGGPRIITAVLQVILRVFVLEEDLERAVRAPRLHQQWRPAATRFEEGWDPALLDALRARGHEAEVGSASMGSVQAVLVTDGGVPVGVSDPRRGGRAGTARARQRSSQQ